MMTLSILPLVDIQNNLHKILYKLENVYKSRAQGDPDAGEPFKKNKNNLFSLRFTKFPNFHAEFKFRIFISYPVIEHPTNSMDF